MTTSSNLNLYTNELMDMLPCNLPKMQPFAIEFPTAKDHNLNSYLKPEHRLKNHTKIVFFTTRWLFIKEILDVASKHVMSFDIAIMSI